MKREGKSFTEIVYALGINCQTVSKYWNEYLELSRRLETATDKQEIAEIQERILARMNKGIDKSFIVGYNYEHVVG